MRGNFLYRKIGERIIQRRKNQKISQEKLAIICDIDRTYMSRIEKGIANPSVKVIYKICRNLGLKISRLLKNM